MRTSSIILSAMLYAFAGTLSWLPNTGSACELCCALCGQAEAQTRVCRLVCSEKKITVTCWSCECEDFCLPGPSWPSGRNAEVACADEDSPCREPHPKLFIWSHWKPLTGPKLMTKQKLHKKIVSKKVPSYRWVVQDLCQDCEADVELTPVPQGVMIPPAPAVEDAKVIGFEQVPARKN